MPERNTTGVDYKKNLNSVCKNMKSKKALKPCNINALKTTPVSPAIKCPRCGRVMIKLPKVNLCVNEYCGYIDAK